MYISSLNELPAISHPRPLRNAQANADPSEAPDPAEQYIPKGLNGPASNPAPELGQELAMPAVACVTRRQCFLRRAPHSRVPGQPCSYRTIVAPCPANQRSGTACAPATLEVG
ncbi:hypothetical protein VUR80DRAFT_3690 [Thermomyces stellatus]